jgi:phosphoribosylformylglycinamidine synthase
VAACHDVSDGGLLVALAEMAVAGDVGLLLEPPETSLPAHAFWFGEEQARYVVATADGAGLVAAARAAGIPARLLGQAGGSDLQLPGVAPIVLSELRAVRDRFFASWMEAEHENVAQS